MAEGAAPASDLQAVVEVPLPQDDHAAAREALLVAASLPVPPHVALSEPGAVRSLLSACRVAALNDREVYFSPPEGGWAAAVASGGPVISLRNETAACALTLELLAAAGAEEEVVAAAREACDGTLPRAEPANGVVEEGGAGAAVCAWAEREGAHIGVQSAKLPSLHPADPLRGAIAKEDISAGADALRIPRELLFTAQTALDAPGPRGDAYRMFAQLGEDALAALWLVAERADPASPWAPMLAALPWGGLTPLSWPPEALKALLAGTPLLGEAAAAQQQLAATYGALFPALSQAMPEVFPPELYTLDAYRAATEVWGAYGITFQAEDGETATCLAPAAFLCNHGTHAHIVRYSRLRDGHLCLPVARSIPAGAEVLLSYGAKQNAELLLFYGFALPDNPYDQFPITFELPEGEPAADSTARQNALAKHSLGTDHAIQRGELATSLVAALRVLTADAESLAAFSGDPRTEPLSARAEAAATEALCGTLQALLAMAVEGDEAAAAAEGSALAGIPAGATKAAAIFRAGNIAVLQSGLTAAEAWRDASNA
eukprot:jgi/Tetstr1/434763/TSEL_023814.t1